MTVTRSASLACFAINFISIPCVHQYLAAVVAPLGLGSGVRMGRASASPMITLIVRILDNKSMLGIVNILAPR